MYSEIQLPIDHDNNGQLVPIDERLKIPMASAEVVSQSRMDNANSVVEDLNPFT
jgi:hypothetical protein